jgi:glycine betaine/choline ABC-type transport system substrate-binding protein
MIEARSSNISESNRIDVVFLRIGSGRLIRCLCALILVALFFQFGCSKPGDVITVGSKNFTEQVILGELLASHIESKLGVQVDRRLNLAGTFLCHQAVASGELDLYVEYTGTAFTGILGHEPSVDRDTVFRTVRQEYADRFDLEWTEPLGFNNTFAIMVRGEDARLLGLETISDAAAYTPNWRAGFGYEFMERADGFQGLAAAYGMQFAEPPLEMDLGLMYRALNEGQVDFIAGNSTEGLVEVLDLVVLEDDRRYFPPYQAAPVVNRDALRRHEGLRAVLGSLAGSISDADMRRMNYAVDGERRDVREVVRAYLDSKGL